MKKLIPLYDETTTDPEDIRKANELINTCSDIDYIQRNLADGITIAWLDEDEGVLELI